MEIIWVIGRDRYYGKNGRLADPINHEIITLVINPDLEIKVFVVMCA